MKDLALFMTAITMAFAGGLYIGTNHGADQYRQELKAKQAMLNRMTIESIILDYELGNIKCEHEPAPSHSLECNYVLEPAE